MWLYTFFPSDHTGYGEEDLGESMFHLEHVFPSIVKLFLILRGLDRGGRQEDAEALLMVLVRVSQ